MVCSQGSQARMAFDADSTFDANSIHTDFVSEAMQKQGRLVGGKTVTGSRSRITERQRLGSYAVGGDITLQPGPVLLDFLLPRILGAAEDADSFLLAESLLGMSVMIDKVGSIFQYDSVYVDRAVFRAKAGPGDSDPELLALMLKPMAKTETEGATWAATIPVLPVTSNTMPYILSEAVLTLDSTPYQFSQFALVIDNMLSPRWVNSLTASAICPRDRQVQLLVENPFSATEYAAFYANASQATGITGSLAFTNAAMSTTFSFPSLVWADETPTVPGKTNIPYWISFSALKVGTSPEISVVNDSVA